MQVFVTGANGFIGGAVAAALIAAGHKVRGLVRNKAKASAVAAHDVQAVVGSLDDAALLQAEALRGLGHRAAGDRSSRWQAPRRTLYSKHFTNTSALAGHRVANSAVARIADGTAARSHLT